MDASLNIRSELGGEAPFLDGRAPPVARDLLVLSRLDTEIETLELQEMALVRRLDQVRRDARAAHEEYRAQEIHVMFVESSPRYAAPAEALRRMREWLETASQRCKELAALAESETLEAQRAFDRLHRSVESLCQRRRGLSIPQDLRRLYETSVSIGCSPGVVAVENRACGGCGREVAGAPPEGGLRSCPGCRRVLYWRRTE